MRIKIIRSRSSYVYIRANDKASDDTYFLSPGGKMKRKIITIDQQTCNGCGVCIPNCPEGAIQIIDGKARLIGDLFCDGLGACIGNCPQGAISVIEREAETYDERLVMENIIQQGPNTIKAHLKHLNDHNQEEFLQTALSVLTEKSIDVPDYKEEKDMHAPHGGCPGSQAMSFTKRENNAPRESDGRPSQLGHWPIQMHLISPHAPHYKGADLLLAADCVAFSMGDFHRDHLSGKTLAIACPKLDDGKDVYVAKLKALIDEAKINTLTVMMMQVPCCGGLIRLAQQALGEAERKVPIKTIVVSLEGEILREEWL